MVCSIRGDSASLAGTEGARLHTLYHHRIHLSLLPSQACRITPYRAHHSFKLHLQPEWIHRQCHVLRSPGLPSQLCPGFQCVGWVLSISVFTYAQMLHPGIPSLTHPIKQKKGLHWFMVAIFGTTLFCYMTLGIVVSLWFRGDINETASLNWVRAGVYVCV